MISPCDFFGAEDFEDGSDETIEFRPFLYLTQDGIRPGFTVGITDPHEGVTVWVSIDIDDARYIAENIIENADKLDALRAKDA